MNGLFIRALVLTCVFCAVLLLVEVVVGSITGARAHNRVINLRLKLIGQGKTRSQTLNMLRRSASTIPAGLPPALERLALRIERLLAMSQITMPAARVILILLLAPLIVFFAILLLMVTIGTPVGVGRILLIGTFSIVVGWVIPLLFLQFKATRARRRIQEQFPVAIDVFVRGIRAGHPIAAALDLLTVELPDPIGSEFGIVVDEVTYGAELREALHDMAERWDNDDMRMFVVSLSVQSETGGNLAEVLENLSTVIRERASMLMKVRALSSEGRMTAIMLSVLPVAAFSTLFVLNPGFYLNVSDDPAFVPGFLGLIVSYIVGVLWIRQLVDLKV